MSRGDGGSHTAAAFQPIVRERLLARLREVVAFPVAVVSAPAGYGKSVLLRQFIAREPASHLIIRYDVRADHATLHGFVRGFTEALSEAVPALASSLANALEKSRPSASQAADLAAWLVSHLEGLRATLIIDDFHLAVDPAICVLIEKTIEGAADPPRWIIASRSMPDLPLESWVAYERAGIPFGYQEFALTAEEASAICATAGRDFAPEELRNILLLTAGWPAAFSFAVRASARVQDVGELTDATRGMMLRFIAQQVFRELAEPDRRFLMETCVYPVLDIDVLAKAGYDDAGSVLGRLARRITLITPHGRRQYQYHDLFREFLEEELRSASAAKFLAVARITGNALEQQGSLDQAIFAYTRAAATEDLTRCLEQQGLSLIDRGRVDIVRAALAAVPESLHFQSAALLGIRASIESSAGNFKRAEAWYREALRLASEPQLCAVLYLRLGVVLINGRRPEAVEVLQRARGLRLNDTALNILIRSALANAQCINEDYENAFVTISGVLDLAESDRDGQSTGTIFHQIACVMYYCGKIGASRRYAERALAIAHELNSEPLATRVLSMLCILAYDHEDDVPKAVQLYKLMQESAGRAGDRACRVLATLGLYDLQAEIGDDDEMERLNTYLGNEVFSENRAFVDSYLPARALQLGFNGEPFAAYDLLARTDPDSLVSNERKALRWSEIGLYASMAGLRNEAEAALRTARCKLSQTPQNALFERRSARALTYCALTNTLIGRHSEAHCLLQKLEKSARNLSARTNVLVRASRAVYAWAVSQRTGPEMRKALAQLKMEHLGGFARLLDRVVATADKKPSIFAQLTFAEFEVLRILATGCSSKEIANRTNRSISTVNNHVKAINRKLGCPSRQRSIALAKGHGLV